MALSIYMDGKPLSCCENCLESCMILVHLSGYSTRMCLDCAESIQRQVRL